MMWLKKKKLNNRVPLAVMFVSSVGKGLHWYQRGQEFRYHMGLFFFIFNCYSGVLYCKDRFHIQCYDYLFQVDNHIKMIG